MGDEDAAPGQDVLDVLDETAVRKGPDVDPTPLLIRRFGQRFYNRILPGMRQ